MSVTVTNLGPCGCCPTCSYSPCTCCLTAPTGLASQIVFIAPVGTAVTWTNSFSDTCTWAVGDYIGIAQSGGCDWLNGGGTGDCTFTVILFCFEGAWYVQFTTFTLPPGVCVNLIWALDGFDCCTSTQTVSATPLNDPTGIGTPGHVHSCPASFLTYPTSFTITNPCPECPSCDTCGDPEHFATTTLASSCGTYNGLSVPLIWDAGTQTASGSLNIGDGACAGCNEVTVSIACVDGGWTQSVGIGGDGCIQTPPGGGCTSSVTTDRCDSCITIESTSCFGNVGDCCTATFQIVATTTTCGMMAPGPAAARPIRTALPLARPVRCEFLLNREEFKSGCGGMNCRHGCSKGLPAVPGQYCQTCPEYEPSGDGEAWLA